MVHAIIIDDERRGRETLLRLLERNCPTVKVVAEADSVTSGVEAIEQHHPELVFLDIEMPYGNGFDLLERTRKIRYDVIFTTAYDQYAIKAIKANALDYLLKPIDRDELIEAVDRAERRLAPEGIAGGNIDMLLRVLKHPERERRIALATDEGLMLVDVADIIRCEADGNYTRFFLKGGDSLFVSRTLKEFDDILEEMDFIRVHHSHLVNLAHVKKYLRGDGGSLVMSDNSSVIVSRRKKEELVRRLAG